MKTLDLFRKLALFLVFSTFLAWQLPATAESSGAANSATDSEQVASLVNINTASVAELADGLNGVGEKRAQAIIDYRQQHGAFTSVEQLQAVKGIGEAVLEKNQGVIVLK